MVRQAHYERTTMGKKSTREAFSRSAELATKPEPFGSPFILSVSKGERLAQDRLVEGRNATVSRLGGFQRVKESFTNFFAYVISYLIL